MVSCILAIRTSLAATLELITALSSQVVDHTISSLPDPFPAWSMSPEEVFAFHNLRRYASRPSHAIAVSHDESKCSFLRNRCVQLGRPRSRRIPRESHEGRRRCCYYICSTSSRPVPKTTCCDVPFVDAGPMLTNIKACFRQVHENFC